MKWGQIGQLILQERSVDMLKDAKQRFRDKFGREPGPDDPVFFDPDADTPRFHSAANVRAEVIDAMERAGIRPALIYAYAKTGLIVSETNRRLMSKRQLAEWNAAMDEYEQKPDRH